MTSPSSPDNRSGFRAPPIWFQTLLGLFFGAAAGMAVPTWLPLWLWAGDLFLLALKLMAVPLIIVSIIGGVASIGSTRALGWVGAKALLLYLLTTALAVPLGLGLALLLQPGIGADALAGSDAARAALPVTVVSQWTTLPLIRWFTGLNPLLVIVGSLVSGILLVIAGTRTAGVVGVVNHAAAGIYRLTNVIVRLAPIGVFALASRVTAEFGLDVILPASKLVAAVYLGCLLHLVVNLNVVLKWFTQLPLMPFWRGIFEAQLVAFSTTTAAGTLPVTTACVRHNLGVSDRFAKFVLPIGTTINMDGTALYQTVAAVFLAQLYGIALAPIDLLALGLTAVLASIGAASIPGGGLVVLSMVLGSVGLPLDGVALIAGIDRILDMARTATNVTGDALVAVVIAHQAGELDEEVYRGAPE